MSGPGPTIAILGASGVIGEAVARSLAQAGFAVMPIARRFSAAQRHRYGAAAVEQPLLALDDAALAKLLRGVDIVVNCVGVLQDGPRGTTDAAHRVFVERLLAALEARPAPALLIQISIPGDDADDRTPFSRTKRAAERLIAAARVPFVILRPGFVVTETAYGGGALMRALAALPFDLPPREAQRPFAATDAKDIAATIAFVARRWRDGERQWSVAWDVMAREATTVADVVAAFRRNLGGPKHRVPLPGFLLDTGARAGDVVARLGWLPPVRSTALAELRRGVAGNPGTWIAATGIEPTPLADAVARLPAGPQETWFARLYLAKPLVLGSLVLFWALSGLIALTVAFPAASAILTARGFSPPLADGMTAASSLVDIAVGCAIAMRRTCRAGLLVGIGVSLCYMAGAALLTPALWVEPLGALVKTGPAIVLMLVALAVLEER